VAAEALLGAALVLAELEVDAALVAEVATVADAVDGAALTAEDCAADEVVGAEA